MILGNGLECRVVHTRKSVVHDRLTFASLIVGSERQETPHVCNMMWHEAQSTHTHWFAFGSSFRISLEGLPAKMEWKAGPAKIPSKLISFPWRCHCHRHPCWSQTSCRHCLIPSLYPTSFPLNAVTVIIMIIIVVFDGITVVVNAVIIVAASHANFIAL